MSRHQPRANIFNFVEECSTQRSEWQRDICFTDLIKSVVLNCKGAFSCHAFGKGLFILAALGLSDGDLTDQSGVTSCSQR